MAKIRITPENLRQQATTLRARKTDHANAYQAMKTLVNNLVQEWEGPAQQAFVDAFNGKEAEFKKFEADIEAFAVLMDKSANSMEQTENELKSQMRV